ncbi:MAG: alkaline phosphatase family protein [Planctomycetota bacterium]
MNLRRVVGSWLCAALLGAGAAAAEDVRLVVVLCVDQMRPDTLTRFDGEYRGGLRRLLDGGLRFDCVHDHALTLTGPGHAVLLTGCHPRSTGIALNGWRDRRTLRPVYCVDDPAHPVHGRSAGGRSPRRLRRDALGDWLRRRDPRARVYSVAGKDRAAVLMGGRFPDAAYWYDRARGGFASSTYYHPGGLPDWVEAFRGDGWLAALPETWSYEPSPHLRPDDDPRESPRFGRASPHPLRDRDLRRTLAHLYVSPFLDAAVLRFARALVERRDLGGDAACDLLCVGLSATDTVGHLYGPFSQEIRDVTLRLDRELGRLFAFLDRRGAPYLVVLTSDHGVLPLADVRSVDGAAMAKELGRALAARLGPGRWTSLAPGRAPSSNVYVHPRVPATDRARVRRVLVEVLSAREAVYERGRLLAREPAGDALLDLARKSYVPDRCGDVFFFLEPGRLFRHSAGVTSHGAPHPYDREVPLVFWGPGIEAGTGRGAARTVDIAPTLAARLGLSPPPGVDGTVLALAASE